MPWKIGRLPLRSIRRRRVYRCAQLARPFLETYKEFLVPVAPANDSRSNGDDIMPRLPNEISDLALCFLMQLGLAHNSAAADLGAFQFKLRFDQGNNHTAWSYQFERVGQDQSQRDKRNIDQAK